jgi:hypothetical protein
MALLTGFNELVANTDSVSDWLQKTNQLIELMEGANTTVGGIMHANNTLANTVGNAYLQGTFSSNVAVIVDEAGGGSVSTAGTWTKGNLYFSTNTVVASDASGGATTKASLQVSNGDITILADNRYLNIGAGTDLQLYHDGTDSFIENNTGGLYIQGDGITLRSDTGPETYISANVNGAVSAYYDNSVKLETTSTGINVTGNTVTDGLQVDGNGYVSTNTHLGGTTDATHTLQVTGDASISSGLELTGLLDVDGDANVTGNTTSAYFIGDGSQLTAVPAEFIDVTSTTTDTDYKLTFVDSTGTDKVLRADSTNGILYNPSTDKLTTVNFESTGDLTAANGDFETLTANTLSASSFELSDSLTVTDLTVTGTAVLGDIDVGGLSANGAAMVGDTASVTADGATVISSFPVSESYGFKFLVQANNALSTSAYFCEIGGAHNGTTAFFTRYGEIDNDFQTTLSVDISGGNVRLLADCDSATVSNTHTFNIVQIQTRPHA